jgi:hypothetical protein
MELYLRHWDVVALLAFGQGVSNEAKVVQSIALCAAPLVLNEYGVNPRLVAACQMATGTRQLGAATTLNGR